MRLYELARELGITSKGLLAICRQHRLGINNHMKTLTEEQITLLKEAVRPTSPPPPPPKRKKKKKGPPAGDGKAQQARPKADAKKGAAEGTAKASPKDAERKSAPPPQKEGRKKKKKKKDEKEDTPFVPKTTVETIEEMPRPSEPITVPEDATVREFADLLGWNPQVLIGKLIQMNIMVTINDTLDKDTMILVAEELGIPVAEFSEEEQEGAAAQPETQTQEAEKEKEDTVIPELEEPEEDESQLRPRPPVVTLLGHVDHGKTSLLDKIRHSKITESEHGGITQHIGAYSVEHQGNRIVFLDTPGHEAFTAMRARGAHITDIAILVVAADDGVMPQTEEAISHVKAAGIPMIVAVNKMDLPDANPERVKQQLSALEVLPEEWGGDTIFVEVSARTGEGIEDLLEMIILQAEMMELKANPDGPARGVVVESELSPKEGPLAHVLVRSGTLKVGDAVVCGTTSGRVRALRDDRGKATKSAGPSSPVTVLGLQELPQAGDKLTAVADVRRAREIVEILKMRKERQEQESRKHVSLSRLLESLGQKGKKELRIILKADVQGSLEAVEQSLQKLQTEEVELNIIHKGVGRIGESDILLADASDAVVIGFQVGCTPKASTMAADNGIEVKTYSVIYDLIDEMDRAMKGLISPEEVEEKTATLRVRAVFKISRLGNVAGCYVEEGTISRNDRVRVIRDGNVIYTGRIASLKRFKEDVGKVEKGFECGLRIEGFNDVQEGDTIESFVIRQVERNQQGGEKG